jgi:hypothetical protein
MEPLLLKTSEQVKLYASPEYEAILNELPLEGGVTAQSLSQKLGTPLLEICYSLEKLEKNKFAKLLSEDKASGVLGKNYVKTAENFIIKKVVGDYEEVTLNVNNGVLETSEEPKRGCSFCGKTVDKVEKLIAGQADAHICNKCVTKCYEILNR